ncbi:MAG: UPF0280 family protein [Bacteroidales bacterium]|nr:UPF0280 family protein [Bacteroidales bacterium]
MFEPRIYRKIFNTEKLGFFTVEIKETDVYMGIDKHLNIPEVRSFCEKTIYVLRNELESYIQLNPDFGTSYIPLNFDDKSPLIAQNMFNASEKAGIGPMGAVAGAFAELIGKAVIHEFNPREIIAENGGDIFLFIKSEKKIAVFAGKSPLSEKINIIIPTCYPELGVCTSSGTVGHSFSYGNADAVMVACKSAPLADAYATAIGNSIQNEEMVDKVIDKVKNIEDILSCVIIKGEKMGVCGKLEIQL